MGWLTKPDASCYDLKLPQANAEAAKMLYKLNKGILLTDGQVEAFWMTFKVEKFDGVNWYERETRVYSHFMQWLKYQNAVEIKEADRKVGGQDTPLNRLKIAYKKNKSYFPMNDYLRSYELIVKQFEIPNEVLAHVESTYERGSDKWKKAIVMYYFDNN